MSEQQPVDVRVILTPHVGMYVPPWMRPSIETPEETERKNAEYQAERDAENAAAYEVIRALDAVTDDFMRAVLDLHQRDGDGWGWQCRGCDAEGYECEYPQYPCRTTMLVAERIGKPFDRSVDVDRPRDGSMDWRQK